MKNYKVDKIRNVALLGHGGSGKTTLTEAMLYTTGVIKRMGKVEDGNTVSDFDKEEISRQFSIGTSVIPIEWNNSKYNILDTPGYFDFSGEVISALRVAGGAIIMVDATSGVEVGTEKAWKYTEERKMPKIIFINKMDKENVNYDKLIKGLRDAFGKKIAPFAIPIGEGVDFKGFVNVVDMIGREYNGKECVNVDVPAGMEDKIAPIREMLIESVAESDEELLEKYFEGEEFTTEEIHEGLRKGVLAGDVVPVLVGSVVNNIGIHTLFEMTSDYMPTPKDMHNGEYEGVSPDNDEVIIRKVDEKEPFSALVFKTIVDPFVGKISLFKVYSGKLTKDMEVLNANKDEKEKIGSLFMLRGKNQLECDSIVAGDIGAIAKLQYTETGDTLCDKSAPIKYHGIKFPEPCLFLAVEPKSKGDEEKIGTSLHRLTEEDPTFVVERNKETKQLLIGGQGNMQLTVITNKMKNNFGVEVDLVDPKIAFRETIKGTSSVQGKHKKQSGGAGQYGDVHIRFEPSTEEFEFAEEIFGGSVPKQYIPAVEKGLRESMEKGVLAGFPVVNVKATLFDGSYHSVDSSEMAFKIAASLAFKKGIEKANPVLLEPIMHVEVLIPEEYMGDIMGDMNKRRGRILGMEPTGDGYQRVIAEAPQAEMFKYAPDLRSMTQARGSFTMKFERYDEVPAHLAQKIIEAAKQED
ncbi:elongation factor G [Paramaledivibacter caminithermalis]|jgi:elongation factor G|uniref:Elongation factor G n=1 Tax=Paramaledivibacter caminithermalis (strain DSM 15212 / CIP 107654 / DViRD3) TaxID=1121301 RepID=A0A1M6N202_PARC5|nr:elongation factor G [Paramaledivibacter caminithermalis]SHJ89737.1 translation elongation factor 2 (EF-2/EF-G) [Paramaledivibacter caminithermalis DSM 15212]